MTELRLRTASRLHFGLLGWGPGAARQFGGVGLMVERPGIELVATPSTDWQFEGPLAGRVREVVDRLRRQRPRSWRTPRILSRFDSRSRARLPSMSAWASARSSTWPWSGSCWRCATTEFHSFQRNWPVFPDVGDAQGLDSTASCKAGFLSMAEGATNSSPPPIARMPFPDDWSILLVQPPGPPGRSGPTRYGPSPTSQPPSDRITDRLCRLILLGILPAVAERDLPRFGAAVSEMQHHVAHLRAHAGRNLSFVEYGTVDQRAQAKRASSVRGKVPGARPSMRSGRSTSPSKVDHRPALHAFDLAPFRVDLDQGARITEPCWCESRPPQPSG